MVLGDIPTNETLILVAAITATPATVGAIIGFLNHRQIRTPSKRPLGEIAERTHHLSETTSATLTAVLNGQNEEATANDQHDS